MRTPFAEALHNSEVKSRGLEQEEGGDGKPELHVLRVSIRGQPPIVEAQDSDPGVGIEDMEKDWTKQASAPVAPGAVLENVRSVYSELSDEILVRGWVRFCSLGGTMLDHRSWHRKLQQQYRTCTHLYHTFVGSTFK